MTESDKESLILEQLRQLQAQLVATKKRTNAGVSSPRITEQGATLYVVCHRVPFVPVRESPTSAWCFQVQEGEYRASATQYFSERKVKIPGISRVVHVGWPSVTDIAEEDRADITAGLKEKNTVPVYLSKEEIQLYYHGYCKKRLWPLFHYLQGTPDSDPVEFSMDPGTADLQWKTYVTVNERFAQTIAEEYKPGDLVFVQDYHLMMVPHFLRQLIPRVRIGWYCHVPFPASELYRTLPQRKELLQSLMASDLAGFHVYDYAQHFSKACVRVLGAESAYPKLTLGTEHSLTLGVYPIGINTKWMEELMASSTVKDTTIQLQRKYNGKKIILGIDRLDHIKGIPHKMSAIDHYLTRHPEDRERVVFVQVVIPPQKVDLALQHRVHEFVGFVNGRHGTLGDVPLHYIERNLDWHEKCALYSLADVMLVTSLRDGMNTVPFEFVMCTEKRLGALVLSEFTGAAQCLGAGAIIVNPLNIEEVSYAIEAALVMPTEERKDAYNYCRQYVEKFSAKYWIDTVVEEMFDADTAELEQTAPKRLTTDMLQHTFREADKRLILVGMVGVLASYTEFNSVEGPPEAALTIIRTLAKDPKNTIIIFTERGASTVAKWVGDIPVYLTASNMTAYRTPSLEWEPALDLEFPPWVHDVLPIMQYFEERTPGTFIEMDEAMVAWHYRNALPPDFGELQAYDLQIHLSKVVAKLGVEIVKGDKSIAVRIGGQQKLDVLMKTLRGSAWAELDRSGSVCDSSSTTPTPSVTTSAAGSVSSGGGEKPALTRRPSEMMASLKINEYHRPRFVMCLGEVPLRDEDMFSTVEQLVSPGMNKVSDKASDNESGMSSDNLDVDADSMFTCCVGKHPSQAKYYVESPLEAMELLKVLAMISIAE
eukprot:GFYU01005814.1.p1 GENE.GFYU01005814.1~~GFYU01005814.1.p1  ORF type:complete len:879 (+),score=180.95 GFYU01005814.1:202-2838(+)